MTTIDKEVKFNDVITFLKAKGADECFHKTSTFFNHLVEVHDILQAWNAPKEVCLLGLCHSVYATSWVSLKICSDRKELQDLLGSKVEELVYQFCNLDRMKFTFDLVLQKLYHASEISEKVEFEGSTISKRNIAIFILLTISDFAEQWNSWQDKLFLTNQRSDLAEFFEDILHSREEKTPKVSEFPGALFPGTHQPGLYLHVLSRLNQVLQKCNEPDLTCPMLRTSLTFEKEKQARDLYCECRMSPDKNKIIQAIELNPHVAELYNVLAQICLVQESYEEALTAGKKALEMFTQWGTSWDKSISYASWLIHTKLLIFQAQKKSWPKTSMGVIELGLTH